jgi:3-oxoacyl-[acyl-carrier-protein] synthase-1/3-oxoacyl-[acyl-carrier-protein] synthase II
VPGHPVITPGFYAAGGERSSVVPELLSALGGAAEIRRRFGAVMAGIPGAMRDSAGKQLTAFLNLSGFSGPVIDYRRHIGEFASASAVAAVLALEFVKNGAVAGGLCPGKDCRLIEKGILVLGLGQWVTAVAVEKAQAAGS